MAYENSIYWRKFSKKRGGSKYKKTDALPYREYQFDDFLSIVGNREIGRLFGLEDAHPKLKTGDPGDKAEQDADKIANAVVKNEQTDDASAIKNEAGASVNPPSAQNSTSLPGGKKLEKNLRAYFEPRFGVDLGNVRVHADEHANRLSQYIHARAFALGNDIAFGKNQYKPETAEGKKLIAHELAHVLQGDGSTIRRKTEAGWILHKNGTIAFNEKNGLTIEYTDAEGKMRTVTEPLSDQTSLSKSVMAYIGGRKEAEALLVRNCRCSSEELKLKSDDDIAYLLMITHGATWDGKQYVTLESVLPKGGIREAYETFVQGIPLADRLVFTASPGMRRLVEELEKKSRKEYEEKRLREEKERALYKPSSFMKAYPEAKQIFDEHKLDSFWSISEEARLNFMKQYRILYDNQEKYKPIETSPGNYATTCNLYYGDYLRSKGYGRALKAIDGQVFSPELSKKGTPAYDPDLFTRRNNPVNKIMEYEKKHSDEIETFTDPKRALDLTNQGHDVGVVGYYFDKDDVDKKKARTHFSIIAPSNIILTSKAIKMYNLINIKSFPEIHVVGEPSFGKSTELLIAQSGARLGFLDYLWAFNNIDPYIRFDNNYFYYGIIFILFKKK